MKPILLKQHFSETQCDINDLHASHTNSGPNTCRDPPLGDLVVPDIYEPSKDMTSLHVNHRRHIPLSHIYCSTEFIQKVYLDAFMTHPLQHSVTGWQLHPHEDVQTIEAVQQRGSYIVLWGTNVSSSGALPTAHYRRSALAW